jgi:hypothetical protein
VLVVAPVQPPRSGARPKEKIKKKGKNKLKKYVRPVGDNIDLGRLKGWFIKVEV